MRATLVVWMLLAGLGAARAQNAGAPAPGLPVPASGATPAPAGAETRLLLEAIAKATREAVDYQRVTPDLLTQILAKLDKIENKLDKVENAIKAGGKASARR